MTTSSAPEFTGPPDLSSTTVVITGANSGIGREAAAALASHGARVVLAVRDTAKGDAAAAAIGANAEVRHLDLASLASVRRFVEAWGQEPIDLLINNAGVMIPPLTRTPDGFELQFGTNHLGHFALTNLLLPNVRGRVVTVSSDAHKGGTIDFDDLNWERKRYRAWVAYAQSKLANLLFTSELQRRLSATGSAVIATAAHPGYAATNLQSSAHSPIARFLMNSVGNRLFAQSAQAGSLPTLYAATMPIPGDSFVGPDGFQQARGKPTLVGRSKAAQDMDVARRLWSVSEQLTGVAYPG